MVSIRPEQISALEQRRMTKFEDRAVAHLKRKLSDVAFGNTDEALRARVRSSVGRARRYGLATEQEVIAFLDASFLLGDEAFDVNSAYRWAADLLADDRYTPREKAALLLDRAFDIHAARQSGS